MSIAFGVLAISLINESISLQIAYGLEASAFSGN